jgi:hypothetical protein
VVEDKQAVLSMTGSFGEALAELMSDVGRRVDVNDEHARFDLYRSLLEDPHWRPGLLLCLALEPDPALATSVLASLLELVAAEERPSIVSAAPASGEEFLGGRAHDLELLELLQDEPSAGEQPSVADETLASLIDGSDWLQRRVAEAAVAPPVLSALADRGRTRKVRARAAARLRLMSR